MCVFLTLYEVYIIDGIAFMVVKEQLLFAKSAKSKQKQNLFYYIG